MVTSSSPGPPGPSTVYGTVTRKMLTWSQARNGIVGRNSNSSLSRPELFAGQFHEGEKTNIHISIVAQRVILVVLFDERSSLGLVRLRVRKASEELTRILDNLVKKAASSNAPSVFAEITDDDIDNLFND